MYPTEEDIAKAKEYVLRRMGIQKNAETLIHKYMMEAAQRIYDISVKYNIPPKFFQFSHNKELEKEVNEVIEWLAQMIMDIIESTVIAASEKDKGDILAYMAEMGDEYSISELIHIYTDRFKFEIEAFLAAGLAYNLSKAVIVEEIAKSLEKPYMSDLLQKAFKDSGFRATRIITRGITYGVGQYTSSKNAINRLENATAGIIWWWWWSSNMKRDGASFFYQMRGSSYPCQICDDLVGIYPISDIDKEYPHAHCYCIRVPIYV